VKACALNLFSALASNTLVTLKLYLYNIFSEYQSDRASHALRVTDCYIHFIYHVFVFSVLFWVGKRVYFPLDYALASLLFLCTHKRCNCSTRLETRTKEFNWSVSCIVLNETA